MTDTFVFEDGNGDIVKITRMRPHIPLYTLKYPKIEEMGIWEPEENYLNVASAKLFTYVIGGIDTYNMFNEWNALW